MRKVRHHRTPESEIICTFMAHIVLQFTILASFSQYSHIKRDERPKYNFQCSFSYSMFRILTSQRLMMILKMLQMTKTTTIPTSIMAILRSRFCLLLDLMLAVVLLVMVRQSMLLIAVKMRKGMKAMTRKLARRMQSRVQPEESRIGVAQMEMFTPRPQLE